MLKRETDFDSPASPGVSPVRWWIGLWLLLFGLAFALYSSTIGQPYFWDDAPNLQFAISRTLVQIWTDVTGLPYYRPLSVTLNRVLFAVMPTGRYWGAHLLLVVLHVMNSWLVGIATSQLLNLVEISKKHPDHYFGLKFDQWVELTASLLFVTYPFSALPIIQFGSLVHPLVTFFTLIGVVSIFAYAAYGQIRWFLLALVASLLAPFVHESGVMAGPTASLGLLLVMVATQHRSWWRIDRDKFITLALLPLASALFVPIWLLVPKTRGESIWMGWDGIFASLTFFSQSFSFPLQRIARLWMDLAEPSMSDWTGTLAGVPSWHLGIIWLVSGVALLLLTLALKRNGRRTILVFGLVWTLFAALPSIVGLPFSYISVSQRLLYLTGAPAVILWSVFLLNWGYPAPGWSTTQFLLRSASAGLTLAVMLTMGIWYIGQETSLHTLALKPLSDTIEIVRNRPGQHVLFVNPPLWINYRHAAYALGHEGVSVSATYIDFDHLIDINTANAVTSTAVTFPDIKTELDDYYYATVNEDTPWTTTTFSEHLGDFDSVWITEYSPDGIRVVPAGWVHPGLGGDDMASPETYLARFDEGIFLTDMQTGIEGNNVQISLDWLLLKPLSDATIFRHMTKCSGEMLAQGDGVAVGRTLPFEQLAAGAEIRDIRALALSSMPVDDCIQVFIGLFYSDGSRVVAVDGEDIPFADNAFSMQLRLSDMVTISPGSMK